MSGPVTPLSRPVSTTGTQTPAEQMPPAAHAGINISAGVSASMQNGLNVVSVDSKKPDQRDDTPGLRIFNPHLLPPEHAEPVRRQRRLGNVGQGLHLRSQPQAHSSGKSLKEWIHAKRAQVFPSRDGKATGKGDLKSPLPQKATLERAMLSNDPKDAQLRTDYHQFCVKECSTENLIFVQQIDAFFDDPTPSKSRPLIDSASSVNLTSEVYAELSAFSELEDAAVTEADLNRLIEALGKGQEIVMNMVVSDTWARFLKDPRYAHYDQ